MCNVGIEGLGRGRIVGCLGIDDAGIYPNAEFLRVKSHFKFSCWSSLHFC